MYVCVVCVHLELELQIVASHDVGSGWAAVLLSNSHPLYYTFNLKARSFLVFRDRVSV